MKHKSKKIAKNVPHFESSFVGLFQPSHMQFAALRKNDSAGEPSLEEMTEKAIQIMQNDPDGFVLVVECKYNPFHIIITWSGFRFMLTNSVTNFVE